jgi:hypothetical protein
LIDQTFNSFMYADALTGKNTGFVLRSKHFVILKHLGRLENWVVAFRVDHCLALLARQFLLDVARLPDFSLCLSEGCLVGGCHGIIMTLSEAFIAGY